MASATRARIIGAAPQAVWEVLADFGSISRWAGNVDHSCLLEHGPDGPEVGTARRVQVGRTTLVERITEYRAPTVLAYDVEGLPGPLRRVANRWEVRPAGEGRAEVTVRTTVELGANPVARLAAQMLCRAAAKQSEAMLTALAETVQD